VFDAEIATCLNCLRKGSTCADHTVIACTCEDCGGPFLGTHRTKRCADCIVARERARYAGGERKRTPRVTVVCVGCGRDFVGYASSKKCMPCKREQKRLEALGYIRGFRPIKATKPKGPVTPPVCKRCCFFKAEPTYPSGMVCLAEAFLRCSPWAPGARPLKERSDVSN
jgi:hypothetical protein